MQVLYLRCRRCRLAPAHPPQLQLTFSALRPRAGVFLERHGSALLVSERQQFEALRDDYEINFYLKLLEDRELAAAAATADAEAVTAAGKRRSHVVRNRRLAYMNRCVCVFQVMGKVGSFERQRLMQADQLPASHVCMQAGGRRVLLFRGGDAATPACPVPPVYRAVQPLNCHRRRR